MKRNALIKNILMRRLAVLAAAMVLSVTAAVPAFAAERLGTPEDVYWGGSDDDDSDDEGNYAHWDEIEEAYQYEIYLYCEESRVKEVKTKKTKYNFSKYMTKEGDYTFRVRALAKNKDRDYKTGDWSDYSDTRYVSSEFAELMQRGGVVDTKTSGPGAVTAAGQWKQDTTGWWYQNADGSYPRDNWFQDPSDGRWYFFDTNGYMMTGWIRWNGGLYYCDAQGTPSGAMVTGNYVIDGVNYSFLESGALLQ